MVDKDRLRSMLINENGDIRRDKEDTLVKEMARFLFDNGYPVIYHVQTENLQTDLLDLCRRYPILIEGKALTNKNSNKQVIIRGIAQLYGYLNNFETSDYYIPEAYFVIFRISGPLYDLPTQIRTNRYKIVPVIIDLGHSSVSGSRQDSQPIIIHENDILQEVERN